MFPKVATSQPDWTLIFFGPINFFAEQKDANSRSLHGCFEGLKHGVDFLQKIVAVSKSSLGWVGFGKFSEVGLG